MDENSCEDETSESSENVLAGRRAKTTDNVSHLENVGVRFDVEGENVLNQVSERCGSSIDASASGPSTVCTPAKPEDREETAETEKEEEPTGPIEESQQQQSIQTSDENTSVVGSLDPVAFEHQNNQLLSTCEEDEQDTIVNVGPPPSYSFVMKQKKKYLKPAAVNPVAIDRPPLSRPPPPTYSGNRTGFYLPPQESRLERVCDLPSFAEPLWRSHSQPALCPRCGIIILTTIHSHDSIATHVAALALCLFGCWPCCLLPYCLNTCKSTYHHCPICQSFLGVYSPW